ncbi:MAG: heavy metal transporter [Flavobacteriales bacterium]|nr:MAG: heavy metal transporter [Flavobacteriales bacterium]
MGTQSTKGAIITAVIAAIGASSCCIPPVIALIAGVGGASSAFSWVEPFRPYLIVLAAVALVYAWRNHFKLKPTDDCGCDVEKPKFFQTKGFLIGMTFFAAISIAFPYYSGVFLDNKKEVKNLGGTDLKKVEFKIYGMTCDACQNHINFAVNELPGIASVTSSYDNGNTIIEFDKTKITIEELKEALNSTGYRVGK